MGLASRIASLLGISAYADSTRARGPSLGDPQVEKARSIYGGNITRPPTSITRWYHANLESALHEANAGNLFEAAKLFEAARMDGTLSGLLSTRTDGLVRLPKKFTGPDHILRDLQAHHDAPRSVFDEMLPASELAAFTQDGIGLGVAVGELVPIQGRDYPVFVRLPPEYLVYRWTESRWYYNSNVGLLPITPGDGRWVLFTAGRQAPWLHGQWRALGQSWITKQHAQLAKANWESTLANPARIAVAPNGATPAQTNSWFRSVIDWGLNTVFQVNPGYDLKLLESNGRGWECFLKTIEACNLEMAINLCGQSVTVDGGAGFSNSAIHASIRSDLIKATADALAYVINTQVLPAFVVNRYGEEALADCPSVEWDVEPPKDLAQNAQTLVTTAQAIAQLSEALAATGRQLDVEGLCLRFGVPLTAKAETPAPKLSLVQGGAQ